MDCIVSELKDVEDLSLIQYVSKAIQKQEIRSLFESYCEQGELVFDKEVSGQDENNTYLEPECGEHDDTVTHRDSRRGQKEEEYKKEKQQQEAFNPKIEKNPDTENNQKVVDVKEIIEFWDDNGFVFSNMNAKEQLLA